MSWGCSKKPVLVPNMEPFSVGKKEILKCSKQNNYQQIMNKIIRHKGYNRAARINMNGGREAS